MLRAVGPLNSDYAVVDVTLFDHATITEQDLGLVAKLQRLEHFDAPVGSYSAQALTSVLAIPCLRRVRLWDYPPSDSGLRLITGGGQWLHPPGLDDLPPQADEPAAASETSDGADAARRELTEAHLDQLAAVKFTEVEISNIPLRPTFLARLPANAMLKMLSLAGTQTDDALIQQMTSLQHLTVLNLERTQASGIGLSRFAALESLDLSHAPITAAGLNELSRLPRLTMLNLTHVTLDAEMIAAASKITSLQVLKVTPNSVSDADLQRLRSLRPTLTVQTINPAQPQLPPDFPIEFRPAGP